MLEETIRTGLNSSEYFAIAAGKSEGRFFELKCNQPINTIDTSMFLVKMSAALEQITADERRSAETTQTAPAAINVPLINEESNTTTQYVTTKSSFNWHDTSPITPPQPQNTHFYLSAPLDTTRINRDVQRLVEEVISHLMNVDNSKVEITLEVNVDAPNGTPHETVRTVLENCQTLKITDCGFDG